MENSNSQPVKPLSMLEYGTDPAPTPETWEEFAANGGTANLYVDGVYNMLEGIEKIIAIDDFAQMKQELTRLYAERLEFVAHAIEHPGW